jgi:CheY-like chemotaxis protein
MVIYDIHMADVLVADDSAFHRRLIPAVLGNEHEVVDTAASGVEVVDRHDALEPDVVVMRWALPIRDGLAAAAEIGAASGDTSVVLFGDAPDPERRRGAAEAGVREFLVTPFRRQGLLDAIRGARDHSP